MNYTKPELVVKGSALETIQGHPKPTGSLYDSILMDDSATSNAYEADE
jgi:hypothetical protein